MRLVKLGVAAVNTTVGAVSNNLHRVLKVAESMAMQGVTLGAFPEQVMGGYPPEDWVQWPGFVDAQWEGLCEFARLSSAFPTAYVLGLVVRHEGLVYNCAAVVAGGKIQGLVPKEKLPTYSVFYEARNYARGSAGLKSVCHGVPFGDFNFQFDFGRVATEVCEDLWSPEGPLRRRTYSGAEVVVNLSASPFRVGLSETRRELISTRASDGQCTLVYTNAVGANDGLIFDGGGFVSQNGKKILEAPRFTEGFWASVVDLDRTLRLRSENSTWRQDQEEFLKQHPRVETRSVEGFSSQIQGLQLEAPSNKSFFLPAEGAPRNRRAEFCEDLLDALALGVGDYFEKNKAFRCIGIALSGGRDSMLTLLVAHRYAKKVRPAQPGSLIHTFYMPTEFSSDQTQKAAQTLAADLGVSFEVVPLQEAFERECEVTQAMLGQDALTPLTLQNIQARLRALRMWNWSNSSQGLFLQTGNMSEKAVGYTTVGGDLMGALAVIANVPKTVVMYLLDYLYEKHGYPGMAEAFKRPAGPELAANQVGEEELMPFPVLDACFYLFAGEKLSPLEVEGVVRSVFPEISAEAVHAYVEKFTRLFNQSIYKWVQSPLSLHIGTLDLDRERALQLPVVSQGFWKAT